MLRNVTACNLINTCVSHKVSRMYCFSTVQCFGCTVATFFYIDIDIFVNCNWVDAQRQQNRTHLQANDTQNNTMKQNTQNRTYKTVRIHKRNDENT